MKTIVYLHDKIKNPYSTLLVMIDYLIKQNNDIYLISPFEKEEFLLIYPEPKINLIKTSSNIIENSNILSNTIKIISPNLLIIYASVYACKEIFTHINIPNEFYIKMQIITFLKLIHLYENIQMLKIINYYTSQLVVDSIKWKENLIQMKICDDFKINVIPYSFYPDFLKQCSKEVDATIPRKNFPEIKQDDFVILNPNPNIHICGLDKTIDVFIKFLCWLKEKKEHIEKNGGLNIIPNAKLYLGISINDLNNKNGYDLVNQIKIACLYNKLDLTNVLENNIFTIDPNAKSSLLYDLINLADVGINTSYGNNYFSDSENILNNITLGLNSIPQISSAIGQYSDLLNDTNSILIEPKYDFYVHASINPNNNSLLSEYEGLSGGYKQVCSEKDYLDGLIKYYSDNKLISEHGKKLSDDITNMFSHSNIWESIKNMFRKIIICPEDLLRYAKTDLLKYDPTLRLKQYQYYMGLKYHMEEALEEKQIDKSYAVDCPSIAIFSFKYYNSILKFVKNSKTIDFCFIGSINSCRERRLWVIEFAKKYFTSNSIFINTDIMIDQTNNINSSYSNKWESLGNYDLTYDFAFERFCPKNTINNQSKEVQYRNPEENKFYFETMANSKFVLCPCGDSPWSFRFYETLMCQSLPIVESIRHTFRTIYESYIEVEYAIESDIDYIKNLLADEHLYKNKIKFNKGQFEKFYLGVNM